MMKALFYLLAFLISSVTSSAKDIECQLPAIKRSFKPKYARHFSIDYYEGFKIVYVDQESYLLSASPRSCSYKASSIIKTPVKRVAMMSTTYLPALEFLKKQKTLIAFQGRQYIFSTSFDKNHLTELPYKFNPELLLQLKADLVMGYPQNLVDKKQQTLLTKLNIPVVFNKDLEEEHPLARAEWVIFIASFYDKEESAMRFFYEIEKNYHEIRAKTLSLSKASVLVGSIDNGYWSTCGGKSDLAQLIKDAGGELALFKNSRETQRLSLEDLAKEKKTYDVWLSHNHWRSRSEREENLKRESRYKFIKASRIYNNNLMAHDDGISDFWETALQRPDLLLLDLSAILHPEQFATHRLKWYRQL